MNDGVTFGWWMMDERGMMKGKTGGEMMAWRSFLTVNKHFSWRHSVTLALQWVSHKPLGHTIPFVP